MTALTRRLLVALVLVLGTGLLSAPPASANATVSGTVTLPGDATTPMNGTVWFEPVPSTGSYGGVNLTDGTFSTDGFADGSYKIRVSLATMDGYSRYFVQGDPQGTTDASLATVLTLGPTPPPAIDIAFPQIATLSGHVTNGNGDPMPGVTVALNRGGSGKQAPPTDAAGFYDFGYLRAGTINVLVHGSGPWAGAQSPVTMLTSGPQTADLVMVAEAHLEGTLTDNISHDPIEFVDVAAFRVADQGYLGGDRTDASGQFSIGGLGAGDYALVYTDPLGGYPRTWNGGALTLGTAPHLTTSAGQTLVHDEELAQVDGPCLPPASCLLGGVVTDGADPVAGIDVTAYAPDGSVAGSDATDRSGRWGIEGLGDGDYRVGFGQGSALTELVPDVVQWFPEFYPDVWGLAAATAVTVTQGAPRTDLATALGRARRLDVTVLGPAESTGIDAGYRVVDPLTGATVFEDLPDAGSGNHLALLFRPGTWKVLVSGQTSGTAVRLLSQWYGGGTTLDSAPEIILGVDEWSSGFEVHLPAKLKATTAPRVKGKHRIAKTLVVTTGRWNLMTDTSFSVVWKRGKKVVGRDTSYVVARTDAGRTLTVTVTAKNGDLVTKVSSKVPIR